MGGRHRQCGAAGGETLRSHPAATVDARLERTGDPNHEVTPAQLVLAPLCIVAAGAAFTAELSVGSDASTFGAVSVIPVLAASLLRSRPLTLIVAAFAMLLQVGGVSAGRISRDTAGMQISVYLLTLAVAMLQQSRPPLHALDRDATAGAVIRVAGIAPLTSIAERLTRREREVVVLAVQGLTAREIGAQLFIGERTVETHLAHAYGKLGVRSKLDLVRLVTASAEDHSDLRTGTEAGTRASA